VAGYDRDKSKAIDHFLKFGLNENRPFSRFFDLNYYIANNPDLRAAGLNPTQAFQHFINFGVKEGRRPSIFFDPAYYLANNPDLLAQQLTFKQAFENFQSSGFYQARPASLSFDPTSLAPLVSPPAGVAATSLPDWLQKAAKWKDIPVGGTLTYSFVTTASAFLYQGPGTSIAEVTPQIKNNVREIIQKYGQLINLNLVEVPDSPPNVGRIRIMFSDYPGSQNSSSIAFAPPDSPGDGHGGDIHLNPAIASYLSEGAGSYGYETLLFLVGAALGLNDYTKQRGSSGQSGFNADLTLAKDNNTNTVMTKNFIPVQGDLNTAGEYDGLYASTPMPYDVRALQYLYGARNFNNGDNTYNFTNSDLLQKSTIWDSGGTDTLNFSAWGVLPPNVRFNNFDYYFDMNEGGQNTAEIALPRQSPPFNSATGATYLVAPAGSTSSGSTTATPTSLKTSRYGINIAFGTQIENLVGSEGNDEILGNNLPNNIIGGPGDDKIASGKGPDTIFGGIGADVFVLTPGEGGSTIAAADVIGDFNKAEGDKMGLALGLPFVNLTITQGTGANANNTIIRMISTGEYLATLVGVSASSLNASDFIIADVERFIP